MCQSGITPIVRSAVIEYASYEARYAVSTDVSGGDEGKNREWYEEQAMKKIVVWGGLLLALGTVSRLLWQARRVSAVPRDVPLSLPPCMYTYKDVTVSLN
jgi:hypothetical protein